MRALEKARERAEEERAKEEAQGQKRVKKQEQEWAKEQAQAEERQEREQVWVWAREWAEWGQWVRTEVEWARALSSVQAQIQVRALALTIVLAEVRRAAQAKERAEALGPARAGEWAKKQQAAAAARAKVTKVAKELAWAQQAAARAQALVVELAELALNERETPPLPQERVTPPLPQVAQSHPYQPTYDEVVADLNIKAIIDSIDPDYRHTLARHIWRRSEYCWLIQIIAPVTRLPPELLQSNFSTIIDASRPPLVLMLVCKHWYTSVTGIWASLKLGTKTPSGIVTRILERNQGPLDIAFDTEIDRGDFTPSEGAYEAIFAAIEATSRWRSLVVETIPGQADLPERLVNRGLQRCSNATMSQLKTFTVKSACKMSPLLDRLLRILGTTAGPELTTVEINSENVISFLTPAYSPIFRSVKVLTLDISAAHNPVDLLPHLHQLEELTASHLSLPIYPDHINLPFVNTLRHLTLRAVSIQWMSGRTFDSLEICTIIFPLRHQILPIFRTTLPNCRRLTFQGHPLDILDGISAQELDHLSVTSSGSFNKRRAQQSVLFSSQNLAERRLAPQILHIDIEATIQAWMTVLTSMPHLEELVISNACPSSLRAKVLQPLIAQPVHASSTGTTSPYEEWDARLCPSLQRFGLKYHRWLRPSEHFDLIPDILFIISSRQHSNCPLHSFSVWIGGNYHPTFELIDGREGRINESDVELLADKSSIGREDLLRIRQRAATGIPISTIVA